MNQVHAVACGLPFCQKNQVEQANLSIILRIAAIVIGVIAITISVFIISGTFGLGHLSTAYGWSILALGVVLVVAGISIKCIKKEITAEDSKIATLDRVLDGKSKHNNPEVPRSTSSPVALIFLRTNNFKSKE